MVEAIIMLNLYIGKQEDWITKCIEDDHVLTIDNVAYHFYMKAKCNFCMQLNMIILSATYILNKLSFN